VIAEKMEGFWFCLGGQHKGRRTEKENQGIQPEPQSSFGHKEVHNPIEFEKMIHPLAAHSLKLGAHGDSLDSTTNIRT
jgi:hypothetical protein